MSSAPVPPETADTLADTLRDLDRSAVPGPLRDLLRRLLRDTAAATNGLTPEEWRRTVGDSLHELTRRVVYALIAAHRQRRAPVVDALIALRTPLTILAIELPPVLALRPQLADLLASLAAAALA